MAAMAFACPECRSTLRSATPIPAGKKIKCPKCNTIFAAPSSEATRSFVAREEPIPAARRDEEPETEAGDWEVIDEEEPKPARARKPTPKRSHDDEDEEPEEDRRNRGRTTVTRNYDEIEDDEEEAEEEDEPRRARSRKKKKQTKSALPLILGILIGGFLILVLGGAGGVFWYLNRDKNRGSGKEELLAFVPGDSNVILGADIGSLANQPALSGRIQQLVQSGGQSSFFDKVKSATGLETKDLLDHVLVASRAGVPGPPGRQATEYSTLIARSRVPFNQHKIRDAAKNATPQRNAGKTYFNVTEVGFNQLFMPSDQILILSNLPDAQFQAIIGSDYTKPTLNAELLNMIQGIQQHHFWVALPVTNQVRAGLQPLKQMPGDFHLLAEAFDGSKSLGLWGSIEGSDAKLTLSLQCANNGAAKKAADSMQALWDKQAKQLALLGGVMGVPKGAEGLIKELMQTTRFSSKGDAALMACTLSIKNLDSFVEAAQAAARQRQGAAGIGGLP